ncbi:hypothetical protein UM876_13875 [Staphylococcus aureus]|nr:hypothetical protein UM876_13875 [Staphylococcus aureus]
MKQPASQNVNTKKDSATAATTQPDKEESKHKQNESQSANKMETTIEPLM